MATTSTLHFDPANPNLSLGQHPQLRSPLMRLPTEIRLLILKQLLITRRGIIQERARYTVAGQAVEGYRLYPSIIACCQTLFFEGRPMLYGDNRLQVTIVNTEACISQTHRDNYRTLNAPLSRVPRFTVGCLEVTGLHGVKHIQSRLYPLAARFAAIDLIVVVGSDIGVDELFRDSLEALADALSKKDVRVILQTHSLTSHTYAHNNLIEVLRLFMVLRCDRFMFYGLKQFHNSVTQAAAEVQQVVTSHTKVDRFWKYLDLLGQVYNELAFHKLEECAEESERALWLNARWCTMVEAGLRFDRLTFYREMKRYVNECSRVMYAFDVAWLNSINAAMYGPNFEKLKGREDEEDDNEWDPPPNWNLYGLDLLFGDDEDDDDD